jgi:glycosyltransferase involved in cell wall biosynthesis
MAPGASSSGCGSLSRPNAGSPSNEKVHRSSFGDPPWTVLFVANFPANTGFAWTHIEGLFARVADRLHSDGIRTLVAYPEIDEAPRTLRGSHAVAVEADFSLRDYRSMLSAVKLIRREHIGLLYLTDHGIRNWRYAALRAAGVRRIVVHDRVSGEGTPPRGIKKVVKTLVHRLPLVTANQYVAVSEFVKRRLVDVGRVPEAKVTRIYNGFPVTDESSTTDSPCIRKTLGIDNGVPLIACACRAAPEKGVEHLLHAFDKLATGRHMEVRPVLVYVGDGPQLDELRAIRSRLASRGRILMPGYLPDAVSRMRSAEVFVVPSVWQDAFPSAVLEPMARGKPVIASAVGGIPEMIEDGVTGRLVPPGDEEALARAIRELLVNPAVAASFGRGAQKRVATGFRAGDQIAAVTELITRKDR